MDSLAIAKALLTVAAFGSVVLLGYLYRVWMAEKSPVEVVGVGEYIAEVRVHINSYSEVVYRERHATPESARRFTTLRIAEYKKSDAAQSLPETAKLVSDVYKAQAGQRLFTVWPAAGTARTR